MGLPRNIPARPASQKQGVLPSAVPEAPASLPGMADDDVFSPLSVDEQVQMDNGDEDELLRAMEPVPLPPADEAPPASTRSVTQEAPAPAGAGKQQEEGPGEQDTFIDEKNLRLKPFGRKVKVSDFDSRKDQRTARLVVRGVVIALLVALVGVGAYQAVFPAKPLSEEQVAQAAAQSLGVTGFPMERGEAFAKDFVQAYLTTSDETASTVLGFFYNGSMAPADHPGRIVSKNYSQEVVFGPTVYKAQPVSAEVARFVVGAVVRAKGGEGASAGPGTEPVWMFLSVSLYYDKDSDRMTVAKDSPSVVPETTVRAASDLPQAAPLGTGESNQQVTDEVRSTVLGFMKAYAESTSDNHTALDQYLVNDPSADLTRGLGGTYQLNGDPENAITFEAFSTDDPNVAKVKVEADWVRRIGGDRNLSTSYRSVYVLTLDRSSGKWLASRFDAYVYTPASPDQL